ncbi:MAG: pentapeptide repeat-containing protein [Rhodospirillaceae bacterium]
MTDLTEDEVAAINNELVLHGKWVRKLGGRRGDLSFRNLAGLALKKLRLNGIKFTGANLSRVNFSDSDLTGADLFGADLEGADLTSANLTGADFRGANLHRATLSHCVLRGADFRVGRTQPGQDGATRLTEAKLGNAVLCEANLTGCDMSGSDLAEADFKGADLSRAVLVGAELQGANFDDTKFGGTVVELSRLSSTQLAAASARGGVVEVEYPELPAAQAKAAVDAHVRWIDSGGRHGQRLDLEAVQITGAVFAGQDLSGARLRRCALKTANMSGVQMNMADLSYSDLRDAVLEEGAFRGANLRRTNLARARLAGACFDAMPLDGDRKWPANFDGAILHDADLTNTSFTGAVMVNADVGGAIMQGTVLRGVDLGAVKRSPLETAGHGPKERRRSRRHGAPPLFAKTPAGLFKCFDWGFGGLCLHWTEGAPAPKRGETISVRLAAEGQSAPPPQVALMATAIQPQRGTISFRFVSLEDDLRAYLNALLPAKYRKK